MDPPGRLRVDEVMGRRLADGGLAAHVLEERLVFLPALDREFLPASLSVIAEEPGLLEPRHEDVGMLAQVVVERRRAGFRRADDQEVRKRHDTGFPAGWRLLQSPRPYPMPAGRATANGARGGGPERRGQRLMH